MIVGTGGTTGRPKGVMLTNANLETMTALTLIGYPFEGRPVYLALAPLTHAAGVLCFPVLATRRRDRGHEGARRAGVPRADRAAPGDAHVPAADPDLHGARARGARPPRTSPRCSASGTARRRCRRPGWPRRSSGSGRMAQLFGQTEAPMMISMMPPADHFRPDGSVATERLVLGRTARPPWSRWRSSTTRAAPAPAGERGEIVHPQLAGDGRLLQEPRGHGRGLRRTAGTTPATSATSTPTASCTSSTGPRT